MRLLKAFRKLLLFLLIVVINCNGETEQQTNSQIDYSSVPEVSIEKTLSISETEDFIPSRLMRLFIDSNENILITQYSPNTVYQFDNKGSLLAIVGSPGRGPGELSRYANPHYSKDLLVMSNNHGLITEYRPDSNGIFTHVTDHNIRLGGVMRGLRSEEVFKEFYISTDSARVPFGTIPPEFTTEFIHVVTMKEDSLQKKKILSLNKHSPYIEILDGGNSRRHSSLPYRYSDYFSALPNKKLLVHRPTKSLIQILDSTFNVEKELNLNVKDRYVTEADLNYHFPDLSSTEIKKRKELIRDVKPPFTRVLKDNQNRFWLLTDETEKGNEYVILNYEGKPLGKFYLSSDHVLHQIKGDKIFTIRNNPVPAVEVFEVNLN